MKRKVFALGMNRVLCFITVLSILLVLGNKGLAKETELIGAGATFPYPLYSKLFDVYNKEYGVKVNYQAIGSGGGIRQLINKTVDFGGSDAIMSDKDLTEASAPILHIPTCAGAVVVTYNLSGNPQLRFTPDVIADIFLGKIGKWNDRRISEINPGVKLPDMNVTVVHRSDGSGTTFYLQRLSEQGQQGMEGKSWRGYLLELAFWLGRKGQSGRCGSGPTNTRKHRLCRAHLCPSEQDALWYGEEQKG